MHAILMLQAFVPSSQTIPVMFPLSFLIEELLQSLVVKMFEILSISHQEFVTRNECKLKNFFFLLTILSLYQLTLQS